MRVNAQGQVSIAGVRYRRRAACYPAAVRRACDAADRRSMARVAPTGKAVAMSARIVVINPNSTATVTAAIDRALAPLRMADGPAIECLTLAEGPPGIETQAHVEQVVQPLCRLVRAQGDASAIRDRLLQRSGPARLPGGDRPAGARDRRMRPAHGADPGRALRHPGDPRDLPPPPSPLRPPAGPRPPASPATCRSASACSNWPTRTGPSMGSGDRHAPARPARRRRPGAGVRRHGGVPRAPLERALAVPVIDPTQAAAAMAIGAVRLSPTLSAWPGEPATPRRSGVAARSGRGCARSRRRTGGRSARSGATRRVAGSTMPSRTCSHSTSPSTM